MHLQMSHDDKRLDMCDSKGDSSNYFDEDKETASECYTNCEKSADKYLEKTEMTIDYLAKGKEESRKVIESEENTTKTTSSQPESIVNSSKEEILPSISKMHSSESSPKLGFSIAQIMGFMSRNATLKKYEKPSRRKPPVNEENNDTNSQVVSDGKEEKDDLEQTVNSLRSNQAEVEGNEHEHTNSPDGSRHAKEGNNLWRPQPRKKYVNNAAFQASGTGPTLTSHPITSAAFGVSSTHSPTNCASNTSSSAVSSEDSISTIQQNLLYQSGNPDIPVQHPEISTIALLRQYSLMNLNNPWKTASLLSSYSNLFGLQNQMGFHQQKPFSREVPLIPPAFVGLQYPMNNNASQVGSSVSPCLDPRGLQLPPSALIGGVLSEHMRTSPYEIQGQIPRPATINSGLEGGSHNKLVYPNGYPSLQLSEPNVKNYNIRGKVNLTSNGTTAKTAPKTANSDIKTNPKNKDAPSLNVISNTGNKASVNQPKTFPCTECGKVFNAHYNLTRHMPVHTGMPIYLSSII